MNRRQALGLAFAPLVAPIAVTYAASTAADRVIHIVCAPGSLNAARAGIERAFAANAMPVSIVARLRTWWPCREHYELPEALRLDQALDGDVVTIEVAGEAHADIVQALVGDMLGARLRRIVLEPGSASNNLADGCHRLPVARATAGTKTTVRVPGVWAAQLGAQFDCAPADTAGIKSLGMVEAAGWRLAEIFDRERDLLAQALAAEMLDMALEKGENRLSHVLCTRAGGRLLRSVIEI